MAIKAVIFDLDGTLLDTAPDFIYVLNQMRREQDLPPLAELAIRNTVSDGARALVTLGFGLVEGEAGFEVLKQRLLDLYLEHLAVKSELFPGIAELLDYLQQRGLAWGIATNKPQLYTEPLLKALQLQPACVICPDHVANPKPHPESMHQAASQLGCQTEEIIYVGDHLRDIDCGKQANCITIAAAYGYIKEADNVASWQANHTVAHAALIKPIVESYLDR